MLTILIYKSNHVRNSRLTKTRSFLIGSKHRSVRRGDWFDAVLVTPLSYPYPEHCFAGVIINVCLSVVFSAIPKYFGDIFLRYSMFSNTGFHRCHYIYVCIKSWGIVIHMCHKPNQLAFNLAQHYEHYAARSTFYIWTFPPTMSSTAPFLAENRGTLFNS